MAFLMKIGAKGSEKAQKCKKMQKPDGNHGFGEENGPPGGGGQGSQNPPKSEKMEAENPCFFRAASGDHFLMIFGQKIVKN